jgi:hypothetical protein
MWLVSVAAVTRLSAMWASVLVAVSTPVSPVSLRLRWAVFSPLAIYPSGPSGLRLTYTGANQGNGLRNSAGSMPDP